MASDIWIHKPRHSRQQSDQSTATTTAGKVSGNKQAIDPSINRQQEDRSILLRQREFISGKVSGGKNKQLPLKPIEYKKAFISNNNKINLKFAIELSNNEKRSRTHRFKANCEDDLTSHNYCGGTT